MSVPCIGRPPPGRPGRQSENAPPVAGSRGCVHGTSWADGDLHGGYLLQIPGLPQGEGCLPHRRLARSHSAGTPERPGGINERRSRRVRSDCPGFGAEGGVILPYRIRGTRRRLPAYDRVSRWRKLSAPVRLAGRAGSARVQRSRGLPEGGEFGRRRGVTKIGRGPGRPGWAGRVVKPNRTGDWGEGTPGI